MCSLVAILILEHMTIVNCSLPSMCIVIAVASNFINTAEGFQLCYINHPVVVIGIICITGDRC